MKTREMSHDRASTRSSGVLKENLRHEMGESKGTLHSQGHTETTKTTDKKTRDCQGVSSRRENSYYWEFCRRLLTF